MTKLAAAVLLALWLLAGCSTTTPPSAPPTFSTPPRPEDMPPVGACADIEEKPVKGPAENYMYRACSAPSGNHWVHAFYQCTDGMIWLVTSPQRPPVFGLPEPTSAAYHTCAGN